MSEKIAKTHPPPQKIPGVYRVWLSDSHFYIGRSSDVENRCRIHLRDLKRDKHPNPHMQNTFNKYEGSFRWELLALLEPAQAKQLEQELIDQHLNDYLCMNICPSSEIPNRKGRKNSPEHRARISEARKGLTFGPDARKNMSEAQQKRFAEGWPETLRKSMMETRDTESYRSKLSASLRGKKLSAEHKAKISESSKNRIVSEETKLKLSTALKGKPRGETWRENLSKSLKGRKLSEETKAKMKTAQTRRQNRLRQMRESGNQ